MSIRVKIAAIDAKIAALQAKREELEALAVNEVNTADIIAGDSVTANYGRGEKVKSVVGTVLAVKREAGKADLFKLQIGEGFDVEVVTVFGTAITAVQRAQIEAAEGTAATDEAGAAA